jgi:hypothetical protein
MADVAAGASKASATTISLDDLLSKWWLRPTSPINRLNRSYRRTRSHNARSLRVSHGTHEARSIRPELRCRLACPSSYANLSFVNAVICWLTSIVLAWWLDHLNGLIRIRGRAMTTGRLLVQCSLAAILSLSLVGCAYDSGSAGWGQPFATSAVYGEPFYDDGPGVFVDGFGHFHRDAPYHHAFHPAFHANGFDHLHTGGMHIALWRHGRA